MSDLTILTGARPPTNILAAAGYNPLAGATGFRPTVFPIGTPVCPSVANTVIPGFALQSDQSSVVGLASTPGIVGDHVQVQTQGVLTLDAGLWDEVTGQTGGLTRGAPYYLSAAPTNGLMGTTPPSNPDESIVRLGIALSATDFLILICCPVLIEQRLG